MKVKRVALTNFLSHIEAKVEFGDGVNIIVGENAAGKTNLIDSIYFCSIGRSSRHSKDKELLNWDKKQGARVTLSIEKRFSDHEIDIYVDTFGKKRILIDGIPIKKIGELMGALNVVFFSPSELALVKESPSDRRKFLDISLSQQSKVYFYNLVRYNKMLEQRNKVLKTYKNSDKIDEVLELTDGELTKTCAHVIKERAIFLQKLSPIAKAEHSLLTDKKEDLTLSYETENFENSLTEMSLEEIAVKLKELLNKVRENDKRLEYTTIGAHRDDMKIASNGIDLRKYGSQGQQRSAVLSLKLAEIRLFQQKVGESPVLILDDVMSELDGKRKAALFKAIEGVQTLITTTDIEKMPKNAKAFLIKDNKITILESY